MIKRPVSVAALSALFVSIIIINFCPGLFYKDYGFSKERHVILNSRVLSIDEKSGSYYIYVKASAFENDEAQIINLNKKVLIIAAKSSFKKLNIECGNVIKAECTYKPFEKPTNKGNFDEEKYFKSIGVGYRFSLIEYTVDSYSRDLIKESARQIRSLLTASIIECAGEENGGILSAMITGDRSLLTDDVQGLLQVGGLAHIFAISGLHISFLGMGLFKVIRKKLSFNKSAVITAAFVTFYVILCGASASAVRALVMMIVNLGAVRLGKRYDMCSSVSLAAFLLLINNPFVLYSSGFVLSFTAVLAVAILSGQLKMFLGKPAGNIFSAGISITLATLPVVANTYYEFPLYSIIVNLFVMILIPYILAGGMIGAAAGLISRFFGRFCMGLAVFLLNVVEVICKITASLPGAKIVTGHRSASNVILYYVFLLFFYVFLRSYNNKNNINGNNRLKECSRKKIVKTVVTVLTISFFMFFISFKNNYKGLHVDFIDVGQGKCIVLQMPDGQTAMFDCGSSSESEVYKYRVKSCLKYMGIGKIDYMFITHPDTDHISGVLEMLKDKNNNSISCIYIADFSGDKLYDLLKELAEKRKISIVNSIPGPQMKVGDAGITFVNPKSFCDRDISSQAEDVNDCSLTALVDYNDFSLLITGDITSAKEEEIIDRLKDIDVLDVPHHGSKFSTSNLLLDKTMPKIAVISAGSNNSYGHPHKETITRLNNHNVRILSTAQLGEIEIFITNEGDISVKN